MSGGSSSRACGDDLNSLWQLSGVYMSCCSPPGRTLKATSSLPATVLPPVLTIPFCSSLPSCPAELLLPPLRWMGASRSASGGSGHYHQPLRPQTLLSSGGVPAVSPASPTALSTCPSSALLPLRPTRAQDRLLTAFTASPPPDYHPRSPRHPPALSQHSDCLEEARTGRRRPRAADGLSPRPHPSLEQS